MAVFLFASTTAPAWLAGQAPYSPAPRASRWSDATPAPPVSPYLNLTNRGTNAAMNYQSLVRPMLEQRAAQQRQAALAQSPPPTPNWRQPATRTANAARRSYGDTPRYRNLSHYYRGLR
jgi:hypothetical protein